MMKRIQKFNQKIWMRMFLFVYGIFVPLFVYWEYYKSQTGFEKCNEWRFNSPECEHSFCDCFYRPAYHIVKRYGLSAFVILFFVCLLFKKTRLISAFLLVFFTLTVGIVKGTLIVGNIIYVLYLLPIIWTVVSYHTKRISERDFKNRLTVCILILYTLFCLWILRTFE